LSRGGVVGAPGGGGRGREDWPNGIGEPDRRRLADTANTRTMPSRAPHGRATVFLFRRRSPRFSYARVVSPCVFDIRPAPQRERYYNLFTPRR